MGFSLFNLISKFGDKDLFSFNCGNTILGESGFIFIGFLDP